MVDFLHEHTNINWRKQSGLKWLLKHALPLGNWVGCENHKVAPCFKHLLNDYPDVLPAGAMLLALWKFVHNYPLAINLVKSVVDVCEECHVTPISLSVRRWTAHDGACKSLCDGCKQILSALSTCVNKRLKNQMHIVFLKKYQKGSWLLFWCCMMYFLSFSL